MRRLTITLAFLLVWPLASYAAGDLVRVKSNHDAAATADRLRQAVEDKGMLVLAQIDHRANAKSVGLDMVDSQVLLFGAPKAGTLLMDLDPAAGLDLPLRVLVYQDKEGVTWLVYRDPAALTKDYAVGDSPVIGKMQEALAALTAKAAE